MKIEIHIHVFEAYLEAVSRIPTRTPNRWNDVACFIQQTLETSKTTSPSAIFGSKGKISQFEITPKSCKCLHDLIQELHPDLLDRDIQTAWFCNSERNAVKPIVLLPPVKTCCTKNISLRSSASFPIVYTETGTSVAALFHGSCLVCKTTYWYSYKETTSEERTYYDPHNDSELYFQYSRETVFSKAYLLDVTNNITFSGASFMSRAEVYEASHLKADKEKLEKITTFGRPRTADHWKLTDDIIENGWFLWMIINIYQFFGVLSNVSVPGLLTTSNHRDIEELCRQCWLFIQEKPNKWIQHTCDVLGCKEGYVTVDGNAKLRRTICAAKGGFIDLGKNLPKLRDCCPNSPISGNQHKQASKYCPEHLHLKRNKDTSTGLLPPTLEQSTSSESGDSCKKNVTNFHATTAGMLALIKPCGIIVDMCEMYTSESLTQVLLFILRTYCKPSQTVDYFTRLKYLGYDRACQFQPFLLNEAKKGSAGAKLLSDNVQFLVDLFHCEKHTQPTCMPPDNPLCRYHPSLPAFAEIHDTITQSCEQGFKRLNTFKLATRKMKQHKRNLFFYIVNFYFNSYREGQLKRKGLM